MFSPKAIGLVVSLIAVGSSLFADPVIRIRADSWMPYNGDPADTKPGYVVELARAAFAEKGMTVEYKTMPWEAALKAVHSGEIEAVIGANKTEAENLIAQTVIGNPTIALFCRKGSAWKYDSILSLKKVRLGVIQGYSYWEALDNYIANSKGSGVTVFQSDNPLIDALKKLDADELDVIAETVPVFIWNVKASGRKMSNYTLAFTHEGLPIYLAFSKSDQGAKYAAIFDAAIKSMRQSGELNRILASYGVPDWEN